ncbi:MAG: Ig-like domain-containing protein [Bacteroidota bacterium]
MSVTATAGTTGPTAYTTVENAFNAINAGTHQGIINITVNAGTTETASATLNASGTGSASYTSVLIKPGTAATPTITGSISGGLIKILGNNVTIDGSNTSGGTTRDLTINNTSTGTPFVVWFGSTGTTPIHDNILKNCIIINGITSVGSAVFTGNGATATDGYFYNITVQNNEVKKARIGLYFIAIPGTGNGNGVNVIGNQINATGSDAIRRTCIYFQGLDGTGGIISGNTVGNNETTFDENKNGIWLATYNANVTVSNNTISNISVSSAATVYNGPVGIYITTITPGSNIIIDGNNISNMTGNNASTASGIQVPNTAPGSGGVVIRNNKITNIKNTSTTGYGSNGIQSSSTASPTNITIYNNFISDVASYGSGSVLFYRNGFGIVIDAGTGYNIYHNTVNMNTNQSVGISAAMCFAGVTTSGTVDMRDNIFASNQTAGGARYGVYCTASSAIFSSIDYNDYYAFSTFLGYIGGVNRTTIAQMQTGFGGNVNSISLNPTFTSATDLHLTPVGTNSPLDAGINITSPSITTDIDADPRYTPPTIGADEFVTDFISYTPLANNCTLGDVTLNPVTVSSAVGIATTGTTIPRVYFRKNAGAWFSQAGTFVSGTSTSSTWSFVIPAATVGGVANGDIISYYVIAQTTAGVVFANAAVGLVASDVNTVTVHPTTPLTYTIIDVNLTGLTTSQSVCYNSTGATTASYPYTGSTGSPNQYTLTWSSAGPTAVAVFTALPSSPLTVNVPAATAVGSYTGTLTIKNATTGCTNVYTITLTVNPLPSVITGGLNICPAITTTLSSATTGGTWSSSTTTVANVGATTGIVTGVAFGTSTITYTAATGCYVTAIVTVNNVAAIAGSGSVCLGASTTFTDATSGGTWSTTPGTGSVSIGSTTGIATGVTIGTATITYTSGFGCTTSRTVTVNPLPAAITGPMTVCPATTTTLADATTGGTWSVSSATGSATVGSTTGIVTGVSAGTVNVTYTLTATGCYATAIVTVNPLPSVIAGSYTLCSGATTTFSDATPGGLWGTSNPGVVSIVSTSGVATAGIAGTATISYTLSSTGCYRTATITVNPLPSAIGGTLTVCPGLTTTLSNATAGGTWSGGTVGIATIDAGGVVTGTAAGTATITYMLGTGCFTTAVVTVNAPPAAIGGVSFSLCVGYTATLTDATAGGTWSSGNIAIATVGISSGVVSGIAPGTATITYTAATGCYATQVVTVNAAPGTVGGILSVCIGQNTTLTTSVSGGTWSSSNGAVGTINSATGVLTGITAGTTSITYTLGSGCITTAIATVLPLPAAISGATSVCPGQTITLSTTTTGVSWSSSDVSVASVAASTGIVTGVAAGTATITATVTPSGCYTAIIITVNPLPAAITGTLTVCQGLTTTLSNTSPGGTWSSSSPTIALVGSSTGIVTGGVVSSPTTATITYTLPTGCRRTAVVTVNPLPTAITSSTGSLSVCVGSTIVLTGAPGGGTWASSTTSVATISSSGLVSGITAGTTTITYTLSTGCYLTATVTVNPLPTGITGTLTVCPGTTTTLSSTSPGGIWSSGNLSIATVGTSSGIVTGGTTSGLVTITYTIGTGCRTTVVVTNNPLPAAISGTPTVCEGQNTTLSSGTSGGTWSATCANLSVGSLTGIVTGVSAGTCIVTYALATTGCYRTITVTVLANPAVITGTLSVCAGSCTTLNSTTAGGAWISSNTAVATASPSTGVVCGVSAGTTTITYIMSSGCYSTAVVTVTTAPTAIAGTLTVCEGLSTTLSSSPAGGIWSISSTFIASVDAAGVVTGNNAGTATITYSLGTGCTKTAVVTVNASPGIIMGGLGICTGTTTTLSNGTPGGTWTSSNTSVATVSSAGVVTGISCPSTVTISYTLSSGGCSRTATVTVNCLPAAITGTMTVCQGQTATASSATAGGVWTSGNMSVAIVNLATGVITGVSGPGTATITYSLGTGCITTAVVTVLPLPAAISGPLTVCVSYTTTLTDATPGGTWSSSNPSVGTISSTGVVSGLTAGVTTITYTLTSTSCYITAEVTVNPLPAPITGSTGFCNFTTTTLSDATPGGTWSSANPAMASFDAGPSSGELTAYLTGVVNITYTLPTGCYVSRPETIILAPYPIIGPSDICEGSCVTLSNVISGGTWTSTTPAIATVTTPGGVLCGIVAGTSIITYELSNSCYSMQIQTVNQTPGAITGTPEVCVGLTITLGNALSGGAWSSGDITIATVDAATGAVTGISAGTVVITYAMGTGCYATIITTVDPLPDPITGTAEVCVGLTTTLASATPGGLWSSSNVVIAPVIPTTGVVTGGVSGNATITYTLPTGCITTREVTVNPLPSAITGIFSVCQGLTSTLDNISTGGTWSSSNTSIADISGAGVVTGISPGTAAITYTLPTGCISTIEFSVNPLPTAIMGSLNVCAGFMSNLTNGLAGGIWSITPLAPGIATIHPFTGVVTGISPGTATVMYALGTGCTVDAVVTVNALPGAIAGTAFVCEGSTTMLSDTTAGGTWSSSNILIADVDASLGIVSGITSGIATITYTAATTGCINVRQVTVNPLPAVITGTPVVCEQFTTMLSNATPSGAWTSANPSVATVGLLSGLVTGVTAGTTAISYTIVSTGCARNIIMTVNPTPVPITGSAYVCIGSTRSLTDAYPGGFWTSSNTAVATVGSLTGVVSGIALGTSIIDYTLPLTGCYVSKIVTVSPLPNVYAVTGGGSYCAGGNGVHIGLDGSQIGVSYLLSYGSSATGYLTGTGSALDFGLLTMAGSYSVVATNAVSGCMRNMAGSVPVIINPSVAPSVAITTSVGAGDTVCPGGPTTFTATPANGGTGPAYEWKVNGLVVGSGAAYSFIAADGDVVSVTMTAGTGVCAVPAIATGTMTLTVLPAGMPSASVSIDPGDTVCQFTLTNYTATSLFGGSAPVYNWLVNGSATGSGTSFSYVPEHGDVVTVQLTSNYVCRLANTVTSSPVTMTVDSLVVPHVEIVPTGGLSIHTGEPLTLNTVVTNAGSSPTYQWRVNGVPVPGATNASYTSTFNHYDSVTCMVTSDGVCATISTFDWVFITVSPLGVTSLGANSDLKLLPNPNKGEFIIRGTLGSTADQELTAEITDMLGQVIYRGAINVKGGRVEERIKLSNTLANGMYMLSLRSQSDSKVFHFVMEQ